MKTLPRIIKADEIAAIISSTFKSRPAVTCYVDSNAATPTASIQALSAAIIAGQPQSPYGRVQPGAHGGGPGQDPLWRDSLPGAHRAG